MTAGWIRCLAMAAALAGGTALAQAPASSPRPEPRPPLAETPVQRTTVVEVTGLGSLVRSIRPNHRPDGALTEASVRTQPTRRTLESRRGSVCEDPAIKGVRIEPIVGRVAGCGVAEPVRITSVSGVALSEPSVMDCATAQALKTWVDRGVVPVVGELGGGVKRLEVAGHYVCRTRNHQPGARISEHGKGRAIDISGIRLENDVVLSVATGWRDPAQGRLLRQMHSAACGPFGTVLGPNSDRFHQAHFHFDTARYRSGPFCR